ncbi:ogr/Delta-like zinc finger family protein [Acinetobacter bereziniae]|uniref:ogr/Delta-like zinc finger family protein n=1 Tax=Acinetobacter bereziniae TaxID=106648 RepID=UPI00300A1171
MSQTQLQLKINKSSSRPQLLYPHCQSTNLRIRSSEQNHPLLKNIWLRCPNLFCGSTCGGNIEITHQISPSATPNPSFNEVILLKVANDENMEN